MRLFIFLIYFFLTFQTAFSQSTAISFRHLSGPEKWWVIAHPFVACKAKKITANARSVSDEMKKDSLLDGDADGGQVDAFRHAYWMATLSQKMSWRKAISLGKAHEEGNYKSFKKGKADEEKVLPDSVSGAMDLFNNKIGSAIGCQNKELKNDELKILVRTLILQGKMKIISKNKKGEYLDCNGKVIDLNFYKKVWGVPKCLVGSNMVTGNK